MAARRHGRLRLHIAAADRCEITDGTNLMTPRHEHTRSPSSFGFNSVCPKGLVYCKSAVTRSLLSASLSPASTFLKSTTSKQKSELKNTNLCTQENSITYTSKFARYQNQWNSLWKHLRRAQILVGHCRVSLHRCCQCQVRY